MNMFTINTLVSRHVAQYVYLHKYAISNSDPHLTVYNCMPHFRGFSDKQLLHNETAVLLVMVPLLLLA